MEGLLREFHISDYGTWGEKLCTKSAKGIRTRLWPSKRVNALDRRIPNAQKKSFSITSKGKSLLLGTIISSFRFANSFATNSFTPNVVFSSWLPAMKYFYQHN